MPLAHRAQAGAPFLLLNLIVNHSGSPKIFFPDAALNGLLKKPGFPEKLSVFSVFLENYAFSDPPILYQNDRLIKGYNLSFNKKNFSRFRPYLRAKTDRKPKYIFSCSKYAWFFRNNNGFMTIKIDPNQNFWDIRRKSFLFGSCVPTSFYTVQGR